MCRIRLDDSQDCDDDSQEEEEEDEAEDPPPSIEAELPVEVPVLAGLGDTLVMVEDSPEKESLPKPSTRPSLAERFRPHMLQQLLTEAQRKLDAQSSQSRGSDRLGLFQTQLKWYG